MVSLPLGLLICLLNFFSSTIATSSRFLLSRRVLHERRSTVPNGWSLHRRAEPNFPIPLSIALRQSNIDRLEDYLLEVAHPDSANYGKHWSATQILDTFRPSSETVDVVHSWLVNDGIPVSRIRLSHDGSYVQVNLTAAEAEDLLAAEYYVYKHDESGTEHVACHHGYHLPEHVLDHVDLVSPTVDFTGVKLAVPVGKRDNGQDAENKPGMPTRLAKEFASVQTDYTGLNDCDTLTTPECIRALYDFDYELKVPEKNSIGVVEFGDETYNAADLDAFFFRYAPDMVGARPTLVSIYEGEIHPNSTVGNNLVESNMDFQLVMSLLGKKQEVLLYQVGHHSGFEAMLKGFDATYCTPGDPKSACGTGARPLAKVISISYAEAESWSPSYLRRSCNEFGKLGLMGTTVVGITGDNGVASNRDNYCLAPGGTPVHDKGNFLPVDPATCPFVTALGATEIKAGKKLSDSNREVAPVADFQSGGGFSNVFPRPAWQQRAVGRYFSSGHAPSYGPDVYNRTGRGIPDVSAIGRKVALQTGGRATYGWGTSASAPIFAAMIAAVNDARIAAGKGPVGWINPALYSNLFADVWNDVLEGSNPNCGLPGFSAAPGWDPVTGLGTPRFKKMLERFMILP